MKKQIELLKRQITSLQETFDTASFEKLQQLEDCNEALRLERHRSAELTQQVETMEGEIANFGAEFQRYEKQIELEQRTKVKQIDKLLCELEKVQEDYQKQGEEL